MTFLKVTLSVFIISCSSLGFAIESLPDLTHQKLDFNMVVNIDLAHYNAGSKFILSNTESDLVALVTCFSGDLIKNWVKIEITDRAYNHNPLYASYYQGHYECEVQFTKIIDEKKTVSLQFGEASFSIRDTRYYYDVTVTTN